MSKLLNRPLKAFTIYALVILVFSIPVYYILIDYIWLKELDENNSIVRDRVRHGFHDAHLPQAELDTMLVAWNKVQPGIKLIPVVRSDIKPDSIYTVLKLNKYIPGGEINRFRTLSSYLHINGRPYHLVVETNVEETDETIIAIAIVTALFFVLLVAGFLLLNRRISLRIWQPFSDTLARLKTFELGKQQGIVFGKQDIEEFQQLNTVLEKLISDNIAAYNQQKEFTENASHELQTPLALLKSKLDLLIQDKDLSEKQKNLIASLNMPLARVSRVNKNLLLLAKIENHQFAEQESIDLAALVKENIELFADYALGKEIAMEYSISQPVMIAGNIDLIEILLTNMLVNALRHTENHGQVFISLNNGILSIANSGTAALNGDMLFKRFKTASVATPGTGLGLAIIKEICNRYGWQVTYSFENNLHIFSWRFN